jgi:2-polyprenyl-6-methoxyphenol hydroxylase-like FAD-dependent oxidoreductase
MASTLIGRQAAVIGAGMAGLPAAGVLADFFEHVVVVERDILPLDTSHRPGTPQARHTHGLLAGGQRALGELFPGFEQDLAVAGAVPLAPGLDLRFERPGFDPPQRNLGLVVRAMSRPLIELTVRQRVNQYTNILIREHCRVQNLVATPDGRAVSAIRFENNEGRSETLSADLIVDASGRGNLVNGVLEAGGRPHPEETAIGVDITYATAVFAVPDDAPTDWKSVVTFDSPTEGGLAAIMFPLEHDRWIVTLVGRHGEKPPGDRDGFLAYAQRLRTPTIYDAINKAEQLGEIVRFGFPASVRRHFDGLAEFPRGLLPFGDSICRFNPTYGQGMSVAAQEARLLHELLARHAAEPDPLAGLAPAFFAEAASLTETPWAMAATPDLAHPKTVGERPDDLEQILDFTDGLFRLAAEDGAVHKLIFEVLHLLKPQSALRDPDLVERVKAVVGAGNSSPAPPNCDRKWHGHLASFFTASEHKQMPHNGLTVRGSVVDPSGRK